MLLIVKELGKNERVDYCRFIANVKKIQNSQGTI